MKAYPRSFVPGLWVLAILLLLSGLLLLPGMLALRLDWDVPEQLIGPRAGLAAVHGLLAFGGLLFMGALMAIHVRHGLRQKTCRRTGISLLALLPLVVLSGWGIYYIANESLSAIVSVVHLIVALVVAVCLPLHRLAALRR